jgi:3-hydroxyacyl-CoA dehydrogenase
MAIPAARDDLFQTRDTRCRTSRGVLVLTLEQERPTISPDVLDALECAIELAEARYAALVIAPLHEHFAFGATLAALDAPDAEPASALDRELDRYQQTMLRLRHADVPTVAAVRGVAISGGCELLMHCTRVVAHDRSHIGLAEASIGLVPGGGGLKEIALRAAASANPARFIAERFATVAAGTVSRTAEEARALGYLAAADIVTNEPPLERAIDTGLALHAAGHARPSGNPSFTVVGTTVRAELIRALEGRRARGDLTAHQFSVDSRVADILCGGIALGLQRSEADLLTLEREHFIELAALPLTQARLAHLRRTGEVLRN